VRCARCDTYIAPGDDGSCACDDAEQEREPDEKPDAIELGGES